MIEWFKQQYHQLALFMLMIFRSVELFDRINQLPWYKTALRQWIDDLNLTPQSKVLDVGCATGMITAYMAQSGLISSGVDASDKMIRRAQTHYANIHFSVADALDLPFEDDTFDVIVSASLVNIIPDKRKAVSELSRTCKQGGKVSILVPSDQFGNMQLKHLQASLKNTGFSEAAMRAWYKNPPKMSEHEISELFNQAGLSDMTVHYYLNGMVLCATAVKTHKNTEEHK